MSKRLELIIEIIATISLIAGVALNSYNVYPLNLYVNIIANIFWFVLGVRWNKWSLITIQVVVLGLYSSGLIKYLLTNGSFTL